MTLPHLQLTTIFSVLKMKNRCHHRIIQTFFLLKKGSIKKINNTLLRDCGNISFWLLIYIYKKFAIYPGRFEV